MSVLAFVTDLNWDFKGFVLKTEQNLFFVLGVTPRPWRVPFPPEGLCLGFSALPMEIKRQPRGNKS